METSRVFSTNKATVVIQINPQEAKDNVIFDGQEATEHHAALKRLFKAQQKALWTVQIMIGVTVFLFGIVLTTNDKSFSSLSVISGITYWGSFIYISAGSLSVSAQNKLHPCVVKASLGMNVFSAVTAAISILLMGIDIGINRQYRHHYDCLYSHSWMPFSRDFLKHHEFYYFCDAYLEFLHEGALWRQQFHLGITGILLVFSILQFIISICISAFACKDTYNEDSTVVSVALNQRY